MAVLSEGGHCPVSIVEKSWELNAPVVADDAMTILSKNAIYAEVVAMADLIGAFNDEITHQATRLLRESGPYVVRMEKRVPRMVPGRWPWSKPRQDGWQTLVSTAIHAQLVEHGGGMFSIDPIKPGDSWTWDGEGVFQAFIVYTADNRVLMRGGHMTNQPRKGSTVMPSITIDMPSAVIR
jgi:hypothetical protein